MEVGGQAIVLAILRLCQVLLWDCRLQNSPFFCVFKYARAVKQKVWNEAENRERDWGETLKIRFLLSPHTPYGRVSLARFARVRLLRHALPISLLILRKKRTVLQSNGIVYRDTIPRSPFGGVTVTYSTIWVCNHLSCFGHVTRRAKKSLV